MFTYVYKKKEKKKKSSRHFIMQGVPGDKDAFLPVVVKDKVLISVDKYLLRTMQE